MLSKFGRNLVTIGEGSNVIRACGKDNYRIKSRPLTTTALSSQKDDISRRNLQTQPKQKLPDQPSKFLLEDADNFVQVQGLQGEPIHDFSPSWTRDVMSQVTNESASERFDNVNQGAMYESYGDHCRPQDMVPPDSYEHTSHVSLYSVMQSNVPHPYTRNPTHMNMPSGGHVRQHKYISGMLNDTHPSRNFSTFAHKSVLDVDSVDPQGIQGYECDRFNLWLDNCRRYRFGNCEDQLAGLASGRKTLKEVFDEQDKLIAQIAEDYEKASRDKGSLQSQSQDLDESEMQGLQSGVPPRRPQVLPDQGAMQGIQSTYFPDLLTPENSACPQGVQGSDCENFQLWLNNCMKYGFEDCGTQLANLKSGRKSLKNIFEEQDALIREIADQYKAGVAEVSTVAYASSSNTSSSSSSSGVASSSSSGVGSLGAQGSNAGNGGNDGSDKNKLSQKDRLKQAVRDYGSTVVVFHVGISLMSLGGFYLAVSSGLDVVSILRNVGIGEAILESRLAAGASTFVIAYAVHKVFAPVRIAITLTCTPFIVRYLRQIGFLKPPKMKT